MSSFSPLCFSIFYLIALHPWLAGSPRLCLSACVCPFFLLPIPFRVQWTYPANGRPWSLLSMVSMTCLSMSQVLHMKRAIQGHEPGPFF
ncbi:MAG: hypothetical protein BYD32DRAFT_430889 [Podila humilis]|nr:MAG: hypothetical protein BYD32DRAFT_430889 [Podila humilis]